MNTSRIRLKHVATLNDDVLPESTSPDHEITYIDISSVNSNGEIHDGEVLKFAHAPSRARRLVRDGDVVVSTVRTYLCAIAPINNPHPSMVVSTGFAVVRPHSKIEPRYAAYALRESAFIADVVANSDGVAYPGISPAKLATLRVSVPPLSAQPVIADYLDSETARIDSLIDRKQRFIDLLHEKRAALITHAVTKGFDSNVQTKDSGLDHFGAVPSSWTKSKLGRIGTMSGGCTPSKDERRYWGGDVPWVTPKDMKVRRLTGSIDHVTADALAETSLSLIEPGAIIVVVRGMILARLVPVALNDVPVTVNQDMKAIRVRCGSSPEYLLYMLEGLSTALQTIVEEAAHGTRCLRTEVWKAFPIVLPSVEEQSVIVDVLDKETASIDHLIRKTRRSIDLLREYRTALISAAVTGQIDIPGTETSEDVA